MLTVYPLENAADAAKYYTEYYAESDLALTWFGEGAKRLGLSGEANPKTFEALLNGRLPNGIKVGKSNHRPGYDAMIAAPKSVSLLALFHPEMVTLHQQCAEKTYQLIEKDFAVARKTQNYKTEFVLTQNLTMALKTEFFSREEDPHLHTHGVVLNVTQRPDGKWVALGSSQGEEGFYEKLTPKVIDYGAIYRSLLAHELVKLGYELTFNDTLFEIEGFPKALLREYSKRRVAIEKGLAHLNDFSSKAASMIASWNRPPKKEIDEAAKKNEVKQRCLEFNIDLEAKPTAKEIRNVDQLAKKVLGYAIEHRAERQATFSVEELIADTHLFSKGRVSYVHLKEAIDEALQNKLLVPHTDGFTTPQALGIETAMLKGVFSQNNTVEPIRTKAEIQEALAKRELTEDQKNAVVHCLQTKHRFVGVQGFSGTGKTTLMRTLKDFFQESGYSLLGLSPLGNSSRKLGDSIQTESTTLYRFLHLKHDHAANTVAILDECSQVSTPDMLAFIEKASELQCRVILSGDFNQQSSIEWGRAFRQLQDANLYTATLKEVVRQKNPQLKKAVEAVIEKNIVQAIEEATPYIHVEPDKDKRLNAIAEHYTRLTPEERKQTLLLIPGLEDGKRVNCRVREYLQDNDELGDNALTAKVLVQQKWTQIQTLTAVSYKPGLMIRTNFDLPKFFIERGDYLKVIATDEEKNTITVQKENTLNPNVFERMVQRIFHGEKTIHLDKIPKAHINSLDIYKIEERELAVGDKLVWNRSVGERKSGEKMTVTQIDGEKVTIENHLNQTETFNTRYRLNQHFEYDYAKTTYVSQGLDALRVIALGESFRKYLTNLISFYITLSRPSLYLHLYVDNASKYADKVKDEVVVPQALSEAQMKEIISQYPKEKTKKSTQKQTTQRQSKTKHEEIKKSSPQNVSEKSQKAKISTKESSKKSTQEIKEVHQMQPEKVKEKHSSPPTDTQKSSIKKIVEINRVPHKQVEPHQANTSNDESQKNTTESAKAVHHATQKTSSSNQSKNKSNYLFAKHVKKNLNPYAEHLARRLLGEPKSISGDTWRYGNNKGLVIQVAGKEVGLWYDFEEGKGGDLIELYRRETGCDFITALKRLSREYRITPDYLKEYEKTSTPKNDFKKNTPDQKDLEEMAKAQRLWQKGKPVQGTIAERYLKTHRGINTVIPNCFRFVRYFDYDTKKSFPALMVAATHPISKQIQAVQIIYLDNQTGKKAEIETNKRIIGRMKFGAHIVLREGASHLYVAEGPETALSILEATPSNAKVVATLSVSNFKRLAKFDFSKQITFCADNDGPNKSSLKSVQEAAQLLKNKGHDVKVIQPSDIKTDFNDVHRNQGIDAVKQLLGTQTKNNEIETELEL